MGKISGAAPSLIVNSDIIDANGQILGSVRVTQEPEGARIVTNLVGLPAGVHGVHLHAVGRCDAPGFTTAGPHFNPGMKQHGSMNPAGTHAGDLPNMTVGDDRRASYDVVSKGLRLADGPAPLLGLDGAAIVIHAAADDNLTDPSGNSGARIACGILARGRQRIDVK
ncbi:MAG: superoxide dismutase family protein [Sandarakinorhabdus sp.]|nr:superoxide dismutase family protein [Sandarakinorhabdus sp.]